MPTEVHDFIPSWLDPEIARKDIRNRHRRQFLAKHKPNWFWKSIAFLKGL